MTLRTRILLPVFGLLALGASVGLACHDAVAAAARTWPPFVLVAGLLIGAVADEDGTFQAAGALLDRLPGGEPLLYAVAMGLVATALGTLARAWTFPGHLMRTAGSGQTAAIGAVASVLANNLPADVLLGSGPPAHPRRPPRRLGTGGWAPEVGRESRVCARNWTSLGPR